MDNTTGSMLLDPHNESLASNTTSKYSYWWGLSQLASPLAMFAPANTGLSFLTPPSSMAIMEPAASNYTNMVGMGHEPELSTGRGSVGHSFPLDTIGYVESNESLTPNSYHPHASESRGTCFEVVNGRGLTGHSRTLNSSPLDSFHLLAKVSSAPVRLPPQPGRRQPDGSLHLRVQHKSDLWVERSCCLRIATSRLQEAHTYEMVLDRITGAYASDYRRRQSFYCRATKRNTLQQVYEKVVDLLRPGNCDFARELWASLDRNWHYFGDSMMVITKQLYILLPEE